MAELYEIAFAIESQRESIARAVAGAVHERQEQDRQEQARQKRREQRKLRPLRQDKGLDALKLKHARQPGAVDLGAGWKPAAMKAVAAARKSLALSREAMDIAREWEATAASRSVQAGTHDGSDRSRSSADRRTPSASRPQPAMPWTWLVPAFRVLAGMLAACFLL